MDPRRVLVVETLDAAGSSRADAVLRVEALERAGFEAEAVVFDPPTADAALDAAGAGSRARELATFHDVASLQAALDRAHDRLVLVASSVPGAAAVAPLVTPGMHARWWPTGLHPARPAGPLAPLRKAPALPPLDACAAAEDACPSAGLHWSVIEGPGLASRRLAPWDGDYVLVPTPLTGPAGLVALRAFATVAEDCDALDLVFLAGECAELVREARRLGVRTRVHFAGEAPRRAEYAWAHAATATVVGCAEPISGGVVFRALACASPLLVVGEGAADRVLRGWLEDAGCAVTAPGTDAESLAHTLARMVDRDRQIERAIERGREVAALQEITAVAPRLTAALRSEIEVRRRAA